MRLLRPAGAGLIELVGVSTHPDYGFARLVKWRNTAMDTGPPREDIISFLKDEPFECKYPLPEKFCRVAVFRHGSDEPASSEISFFA